MKTIMLIENAAEANKEKVPESVTILRESNLLEVFRT